MSPSLFLLTPFLGGGVGGDSGKLNKISMLWEGRGNYNQINKPSSPIDPAVGNRSQHADCGTHGLLLCSDLALHTSVRLL